MAGKGKDKRIEIRVSEADKATIDLKRDKVGLTTTDFILSCINNKKIVNIDRVELFKQLKQIQIELNNTGKNINQFVKLMNMLNKSDQLNAGLFEGIKPLLKDHYLKQEECLSEIRKVKAFYK